MNLKHAAFDFYGQNSKKSKEKYQTKLILYGHIFENDIKIDGRL